MTQQLVRPGDPRLQRSQRWSRGETLTLTDEWAYLGDVLVSGHAPIIAQMAFPASSPLPFDLQPASDVATRFVLSGQLPCIVFGVADGDGRQQVVSVSGGRVSVRDDSVFFIASVTKAIVATALMAYVDEGRLDLREPLTSYLPEVPGGEFGAVSAWHVLTHTSGLPDLPLDRIRTERPNYQRILARTLQTTPRWSPGSRYEYNSAAWVLLSELMARLSGMPFPDALRLRLTSRVGMTETVFDARPFRSRVVRVDGVRADNRLIGEVLLWFLAQATLPGGGMFSTVSDLLRLGRALLPSADAANGDRILSREAVSEMARPQLEGIPYVADDGSVSSVEQGIGWRLGGGAWPSGDGIITHGGVSGSRLWVDLERDLAYAFLTNVWDAPSDAAIAVLEAVYRAHG
jgi:CubicO group peptidase (beta-lactamase class C family)